MEKDLNIERLYVLYGKLLTKKRAELVEMFYELDLSLGEIASLTNLTRQAVSDALQKSRRALNEIDSKLSLKDKYERAEKVIAQISALGAQAASYAQQLKEILEER